MKKKLIVFMMSLSVLLLAGGCKKEDKSNEYIKLGQYKGVEVEVETLEVTEEDIDLEIQNALDAAAVTEEITDRAVEDGDLVNIDFEGKHDGVAFDGGTATDFELEIGSNSFIGGFEEGLLGVTPGETVDLNLAFPEDYKNVELAGQEVVFTVTVNYIIGETLVPELDDAFVAEYTEFDTVEAYKDSIREQLVIQFAETMESNKMNTVFTTIIENSEVISYPQDKITDYINNVTTEYKSLAAQNGMEFGEFLSAIFGMTEEDFDKEIELMAQDVVTQELVFDAIVEAEDLKLTDDEYETGVAEMVIEYAFGSEEEFIEYYGEELIRDTLLRQKVLDMVTEEAVVI